MFRIGAVSIFAEK